MPELGGAERNKTLSHLKMLARLKSLSEKRQQQRETPTSRQRSDVPRQRSDVPRQRSDMSELSLQLPDDLINDEDDLPAAAAGALSDVRYTSGRHAMFLTMLENWIEEVR